MSEWCVVCCWDSVVFYILVSGGDILKCKRRILWRHSLLPGHEQSYAPTEKGRETLCVGGCVWEGGVRVFAWGSLRDMCVGVWYVGMWCMWVDNAVTLSHRLGFRG